MHGYSFILFFFQSLCEESGIPYHGTVCTLIHTIQTLNTTFLLVDGICIVHVNIIVQSVPL